MANRSDWLTYVYKTANGMIYQVGQEVKHIIRLKDYGNYAGINQVITLASPVRRLVRLPSTSFKPKKIKISFVLILRLFSLYSSVSIISSL